MSNHSLIEHRANYHFLKIEEDFLAICSRGEHSPHCKALILAILEHWMNTKRDKGEGEYVHLTIPQLISYTYMLYERNVITACIQELLKEGFIERREIILYGQKTFEYRLLVDVVNKQIRTLPQKEPKEILPRLDAYTAYKDRAKERAKTRKKEVGEKSPTQHVQVGEKSRKVGDKPTRVREKPTHLRLGTKIHNSNSMKDSGATDDLQQDEQPSIDQSPSPFSLEELELLKWYKRLEPKYEPKEETAKRSLPALLEHIHSFEELQSLYNYTQALLLENDKQKDKRPYLANMANCIGNWLKTRIDRTLGSMEPPVPALSDEELDRMVLWTRWPHDIDDPVKRWNLYEMMTLREAKRHEWDYWTPVGESGPLSEEEITTIQHTQQQQQVTLAI